MGSAQGNWDPQGGQQPFRPNPNGARDCTTTLRRLLIGAEQNDLVCDLGLSKESSKILASRPGEHGILDLGTKITFYRDRDDLFFHYGR